jgi:hypothetical protein
MESAYTVPPPQLAPLEFNSSAGGARRRALDQPSSELSAKQRVPSNVRIRTI